MSVQMVTGAANADQGAQTPIAASKIKEPESVNPNMHMNT